MIAVRQPTEREIARAQARVLLEETRAPKRVGHYSPKSVRHLTLLRDRGPMTARQLAAVTLSQVWRCSQHLQDMRRVGRVEVVDVRLGPHKRGRVHVYAITDGGRNYLKEHGSNS